MSETHRVLRRNIAYLCITAAILWLIAMLFFGFEPFAGGVSFQ